jgi:uncharacterized protein
MRTLILVALLVGATPSHAQTAASSPAKKELVAKLLQLQQPGMQAAGAALQAQIPPEQRDAAAKAIQAEAQKYAADAAPLARERAVKLAPSVVGVGLEEKFSEDELKQLIAWFENPLNKKYQQFSGEAEGLFTQKLVADVRPTLDPKLQALEQRIRGVLTSAAGAASAPKPASAARPPARAASK